MSITAKSRTAQDNCVVNEPRGSECAGQHLEFRDNNSRLQHIAKRLHALGPKPLYNFLDAIDSSADFRTHLEDYAALVRAYGGDEYMPPMFLLREGGDQ